MKTLRIYITGAVQGVFFRKFIKEKADELNIRGFIRNLEDGRVEVVAEGRDEKVNELLAQCKKGSPHSEVKNIETQELKHQGFKGFKVSLF
ncbi:acylphosphatase [archaeon]|jgi:acylphosphatase|nr:acylphosphatase [archaeon]